MEDSQKKEKHAGQPPKYKNGEDLQKAIDRYFNIESQPCISELAYKLGFASRQSLYDYEKRNDIFSYIIKRARLKVEVGYEKDLRNTEIKPTGSIFALKNMGWKDKIETENTGEIKYTIIKADKPIEEL